MSTNNMSSRGNYTFFLFLHIYCGYFPEATHFSYFILLIPHQVNSKVYMFSWRNKKQEAHTLQCIHLSETDIAYLQILCNIFSNIALATNKTVDGLQK